MTVLRPNDLSKLTASSGTAAFKAILVHGDDEGRVREIAKALVTARVGSHDDPFNVSRLDDDAIKEDPARLADEAQAMSLTGGDRAVWVKSAGAAFASAVKSYLGTASGDALIVAESPALRKGAALRELFEKARNAAAIACYEDGDRDLAAIVTEHLRSHDLSIGNDARLYLMRILGADRALSRSELEKLSLHCLGKTTVELADVEAICGDAAALSLDDAIDAAFEGRRADADLRIDRLIGSGTTPQTIVWAASQHVNRLQTLASGIDSRRSAKQAVENARPPIFWKRRDSLIRQLSIWRRDDLIKARANVRTVELQTRRYPALASVVVHRAVLGLAGQADRSRRTGGR